MGEEPRVVIPWSRAAPPDRKRESWVVHGSALDALQAGRTPSLRAARTSLVLGTAREIHLLEVPRSLAELEVACTGTEPLAKLAEQALRAAGALAPMAEPPGKVT
jgi:hypothetical protein